MKGCLAINLVSPETVVLSVFVGDATGEEGKSLQVVVG